VVKSSSLLALLAATYFLPAPTARADDKKPAPTIAWGYAVRGVDIEARSIPSQRVRTALHLGRGALVAVIESKSRGNTAKTQVRAVNPESFEAVVGSVEASQIESEPLDQFPSDSQLLEQLGGPYLEDLTVSSTQIVRYVLRQDHRDFALICFIGSRVLPHARLQVFLKVGGKFVLGPSMEFASSEMQSAITSFEVLDLLGEGNECLVTHEPFSLQPDNSGVNMVIRRIEDGTLKTLWQAPIEFRNLASYPPRHQVLKPPEKNIGSAGTETTATVEFRSHGSRSEPAWKGKIDFYVIGRDKPLESITVEKVCPWDGSKFAALK
jgi:hypothetical protein